ncbi:MAG: hypothetical protein JRD68_09700 [Deltaproteobacteria bacterium]|nr:hypothetical protein [Deltaproteobacteria bacterium]
MSKSRKKIDKNQLTIFELLQELSESQADPTCEGKFRIIDELKGSLRSGIKACPLSRHQVAGEMSHLLGQTVTKEVLDSWTRESDEMNGRPGRHIPAEYLPAFCKVTGSNESLIIMGRLAGLFVLPGPAALRAEIQKLDEEIKGTQARKRKRLMFLREMEKGA